jgi:hypothetical protein
MAGTNVKGRVANNATQHGCANPTTLVSVARIERPAFARAASYGAV